MQNPEDFHSAIMSNPIEHQVLPDRSVSVTGANMVARLADQWVIRDSRERLIQFIEVGIPLLFTPFILCVPCNL